MAEDSIKQVSFEESPILNQTHVECDGCEDDVIVYWYCVTCMANLCDICKKAKLHRNHSLKSWQDDTAIQARQEATFPCKNHPENIYVPYCKTCETLCCGICVSETHSGHKFETIKSISEEKKKKLVDFLNELKSNHLPSSRLVQKKLEKCMESGKLTSQRNRELINEKIKELQVQLDFMKIEMIEAEEEKYMSFSEDTLQKLTLMKEHISLVETEIKRTQTQIDTYSRVEFIQHVPISLHTANFVTPEIETEPIQEMKKTL